ncbi:MAG: SulP family inorganic anion transporter [Lentisphaerae bacterium]|nr:SulP family inorganic anion transporter [Lentisphaerota bacterium]MCP4101368.1 SulP family inorganic anion transporter [Lentisphaerota bacterium]
MEDKYKKLFPFLRFLPPDKAALKPDLQAGIIIAMVLIPQSMAYAELAGLPPQYGLYCSILPCIIAALWGSSSHLSTGPVAMISLITATTLGSFAKSGSEYYIQMAQGSCLLAGFFFITFSVFRLDKLVQKIDSAVIKGFTNAAAIIIILSQINKILGFNVSDIFEQDQAAGSFSSDTLITVALGVVALASIVLLKKLFPKWPSVLLVIIFSAAAACLINNYLQRQAVATVGSVPAGLPALGLPTKLTINDYVKLLPGSLVIAILGTLEVYSISRIIADNTGETLNFRQEFLGQGLACLGGGISSAYPSSGSFSRSALSYSAGAKTSFSSVIAGLSVLVVLVFFTKYLQYLPRVALGAVIISAVIKLINFKVCVEFWRKNRKDLATFSVTFAATLGFQHNIILSIALGILTSLLLRIFSSAVSKKSLNWSRQL